MAVLDATMPVGPGDRRVLERAAGALARAAEEAGADPERRLGGLLVVVNKIDAARRAQVLDQLAEACRLVEPDDAGPAGAAYLPVSAATGQGVDALVGEVTGRLPEGPPYFPDDMVTDVPEAFWVAELVREQLLARAREELPHSIACRVTEWEWPRVRVEILVERESQKGIVIGKGGLVLKEVGTAVRAQLPPGAYVELHVRVDRAWQQRPDEIARLGY
jgi:GTP-binding protein Era